MQSSIPAGFDQAFRLAVQTAFESALQECIPSETIRIQASAMRLRDLTSRSAWVSAFRGGVGGIVLAGADADFDRFSLLQLSHRMGLADAAAMSPAAFQAKSTAMLNRLVIRIAAMLALRINKSGAVRPGRPVFIPAGMDWPNRDFDKHHELILHVGKSEFHGYAGIFAPQTGFTFPPTRAVIDGQRLAAPADSDKSIHSPVVGMDHVDSTSTSPSVKPPLTPEQPVDAAAVSEDTDAVSDDAAAVSNAPHLVTDDTDEVTEDGVLVRDNGEVADDDMWD